MRIIDGCACSSMSAWTQKVGTILAQNIQDKAPKGNSALHSCGVQVLVGKLLCYTGTAVSGTISFQESGSSPQHVTDPIALPNNSAVLAAFVRLPKHTYLDPKVSGLLGNFLATGQFFDRLLGSRHTQVMDRSQRQTNASPSLGQLQRGMQYCNHAKLPTRRVQVPLPQ